MDHEKYMRRCIELAKNGLGMTYPNPMVGAVIVADGKIIGEGWHRKAGGPHAEVLAVQSVRDPSMLVKSTIYVSLEPCSHFGKTPPCCDLIIAHNIPNVVIGTVDPHEKVAGSGVEKLKAAGKNITTGILERDCRELNRRFFTFHNKKRPYVILKWAQSADGFIAPLSKDERAPVWISNSYSQQLAHKWRTEEQAILVGTRTVIDDNPKLDARHWAGQNPVRIVIDNCGNIPDESHIFDNQVQTIVFGQGKKPNRTNLLFEKFDVQPDADANLSPAKAVVRILEVLYHHGLQSVIVEGGAKTLQSFIDAGLWDEARVFIGKTVIAQGVPAPLLKGHARKQPVYNDELLIFTNHD